MALRTLLVFYILSFGLEAKAQVFEEYLLSGWTMQSSSFSNDLPAEVPGSVQYNLLLNGKQIGPSLDGRWSYASSFQADRHILSRSFIQLEFEGLDSRAEVYLNGQLILEADNMFRSWTVPVKSFLKEGENQLRVEFFQTDADALRVRKARYHFDHPSPEVPMGIWKPVILRSYDTYHFKDFALEQDSLKGQTAYLNALVDVHGKVGTALSIEVYDEITRKVYARQRLSLTDSAQISRIPFQIQRVDLWWPKGMGRQSLYQIGVRVSAGKAEEQERVKRTGFRQLDRKGTEVTVNGSVLDLKGADYIPQMLEVSAMRSADYEELMDSLASKGINLIYVMEKGIYESDYFYDLADSRGVMIVQDLMFGKELPYPKDEAFLSNSAAEVFQEIRRLNHHPSLLSWRALGLGDSAPELLERIREIAGKNKATLITQDGSVN